SAVLISCSVEEIREALRPILIEDEVGHCHDRGHRHLVASRIVVVMGELVYHRASEHEGKREGHEPLEIDVVVTQLDRVGLPPGGHEGLSLLDFGGSGSRDVSSLGEHHCGCPHGVSHCVAPLCYGSITSACLDCFLVEAHLRGEE